MDFVILFFSWKSMA